MDPYQIAIPRRFTELYEQYDINEGLKPYEMGFLHESIYYHGELINDDDICQDAKVTLKIDDDTPYVEVQVEDFSDDDDVGSLLWHAHISATYALKGEGTVESIDDNGATILFDNATVRYDKLLRSYSVQYFIDDTEPQVLNEVLKSLNIVQDGDDFLEWLSTEYSSALKLFNDHVENNVELIRLCNIVLGSLQEKPDYLHRLEHDATFGVYMTAINARSPSILREYITKNQPTLFNIFTELRDLDKETELQIFGKTIKVSYLLDPQFWVDEFLTFINNSIFTDLVIRRGGDTAERVRGIGIERLSHVPTDNIDLIPHDQIHSIYGVLESYPDTLYDGYSMWEGRRFLGSFKLSSLLNRTVFFPFDSGYDEYGEGKVLNSFDASKLLFFRNLAEKIKIAKGGSLLNSQEHMNQFYGYVEAVIIGTDPVNDLAVMEIATN